MSSIEPAAHLANNSDSLGNTNQSSNNNYNSTTSSKAKKRSNKKKSQEAYQENEDQYEHRSENDDYGNEIDVEVTDIPQFTVGPSTNGMTVGKHPQENDGLTITIGQAENYRDQEQVISENPIDQESAAPFKGLQDANIGNQVKASVKQKSDVKIKGGIISLKQSQIKPAVENQKNDQKRNLLKKSTFESDLGLSTGRFQNPVQNDNTNSNQNLSKSANQAKILNIINQQQQMEDREFDRLGLAQETTENEMRETSYFKQQTDDEHAGGPQKVQDQNDIITITNEKDILTQSMGQPEPKLQSRNAHTELDPKLIAKDIENGMTQQSKTSKNKTKEGIQMFKLSSRSHMKQRAQQNKLVSNHRRSGEESQLYQVSEQEPMSPTAMGNMETPGPKARNNPAQTGGERKVNKNLDGQDNSNILRSQSYNNTRLQKQEQMELQIDDEDTVEEQENYQMMLIQKQQRMDQMLLNDQQYVNDSTGELIHQKQLQEIKKINQQNEISNVTANFGALHIQKQNYSSHNRNNYSALKGPIEDESNPADVTSADGQNPSNIQNQMFTSMSDIGFPSNIHNYNLKNKGAKPKKGGEELISTDQIQRMMDTQNNWRVRTKTIDELLHDVQDRIETDQDYMMVNSERFLDFFVQLLTDQNFKIVLNTLNILNMIIWMKKQRERHDKIMKLEIAQDQQWGLSNAILGRHIPLIVKKLADSKNIIRQEAIRCLFGIVEIMRNGLKKENNFIALILPYLNNSSNWHIREELLNLLIKCFLSSVDQNEFDSYQIMDSILQLFNDTKEKIRNLALEAIATFASISDRNRISEVMFQLNVEKHICELVQSRLDYGMFPFINQDGNIEIPYQDQFQNYDVDSVAHSMTNQTQISHQKNYQNEYPRRKQSIGVGSQKGSVQTKVRGNSSGRKIVVATANTTNQQLVVSHQDEIMQQAYIQSKRTASANNPNQYEIDNPNLIQPTTANLIPDHNPANSFSYSVNGGTGQKASRDQRMMQQFDDLAFPQDLNGSSFLPKLQKVVSFENNQNLGPHKQSSQQYQRERVVGSSGGPSIGYLGPNVQDGRESQNVYHIQASMPISRGNKRSNKYLHGTPGQPHNYHAHFSQQNGMSGTNLQGQFNNRDNNLMNNSISNQSPSLYEQNTTMFDMSGNVGSLFGDNYKKIGNKGSAHHVKHLSNLGGPPLFSQQMSEMGQPENDILSITGAQSNHHHTPSSFNQDQILYSAGGYRNSGMGGEHQLTSQLGFDQQINDYDGANSSFNLASHGLNPDSFILGMNRSQGIGVSSNVSQGGSKYSNLQGQNAQYMKNDTQMNQSEMMPEVSPSNGSQANHINVMDGAVSQNQNPLNNYMEQGKTSDAHPKKKNASMKKQNNQNTFYSDGTTFTGITVTTGATSQNKKMLKGQNNDQMGTNDGGDPNQNNFHHRGPGPIKATRAALGGQAVIQGQQSPSNHNSSNKGLKVHTQAKSQHGSSRVKKENDIRDSRNLDRASESDEETDAINRSYSYNNKEEKQMMQAHHKEVNSAGIKRTSFVGDSLTTQDGQDPALLTQSAKIIYLPSEDLEPLSKPEKEFKKSVSKGSGIQSSDWFEQFEACNTIRRVCKHHQSLILQTGNQLQAVVNVLIKLADSLRSAVSRIALITLNEMFINLKRVMEPSLDPVVKVLLKKGTDTNHFIAAEADNCINSLVANCQESKVLQILQMQNLNAKSNVSRLKMCQCLQTIVRQLGNNILFFNQNDKLLVQLAKYLQDASQDVRQTAKIAFVIMSQSIMGQNELEKLLQRVLNEFQYKKVKEFLDKEPTHLMANQGSQIDFVITNANNQNQQNLSKKRHQQSFKNLRPQNTLAQKQQLSQPEQDQGLNIQAKSILNPQLAKQESQGFLTKIAKQNKEVGNSKTRNTNNFGNDSHTHDQFFIDSAKDLILKTQVNEWRLRLESSEQLFDLIRANQGKFSKQLKMVELADALCKLLNDSNAKIQLSALDNFNKIFRDILPFVELYIQLFYKSIITNLGSSNVGVRKNSEQILKQVNDAVKDKSLLILPLVSQLQFNSNARLKPALIEQLTDLLEHFQSQELQSHISKSVLPVAFKLLDDNKNDVKSKTEKLFKKLYLIVGQQLIDNCPQTKLQRVCDICLSSQKLSGGTGSSGKNSQSQGFGTGTFGANGNQVHLNSRT